MEQLIAHLIGDYVLQNHWMANQKTKAWGPAMAHALFYGLPFLLLVDSALAWLVIVGTHLLIDRFRLAKYWVDFWGVGVWPSGLALLAARLGVARSIEEVPQAPPFLAVWLLILVDNTMHLAINYAALKWL